MINKNSLKAQQVETLAAQLQNPALSDSAREKLRDDITRAFLAYKGLTGLDGAHFREGETLEDSSGYEKYSGIVFTKAFDYAKRDYVKVYRETGKVIPFCQLLNSALKLKAPDVVKEKLADRDVLNQSLKKAKVEAYLSRLTKEMGQPAAVLKFNVLNKKAVTRFMVALGYPQRQIATAMDLIEDNYVASDNFSMDDKANDNIGSLVDQQTFRDFQVSEVHIDGAIDTIYRAAVKAGPSKEGKALKQLVTYHCFDQGAEDNINVRLFLKDYLDPDFQKFLRSYAGVPKDDRAIAAFTGKKLDTVQKTLCSVRALLKKQAAAETSKANSICC